MSLFSEGPCLIHSMNGDLLRTLEGPENCLKPKLIQASREGHCVIFYDNGFFCTFSVNGKLQATVETDDNIRVSALQPVQRLRTLPPSVTSEEGETSVELLSLFSMQRKNPQLSGSAWRRLVHLTGRGMSQLCRSRRSAGTFCA